MFIVSNEKEPLLISHPAIVEQIGPHNTSKVLLMEHNIFFPFRGNNFSFSCDRSRLLISSPLKATDCPLFVSINRDNA